ncbi:hypothetical protein WAF17_16760 [Bernardetia sp. ABR2-2B]|uniref:hypothetical protein n=1 Tax=Bernardetia sp. ABR2-2B TaxID=3127472 RepID=UPI0030D389F2
MRFTNYQHIQVDTAYLKPTLRVQLQITYKPMYAPLSFASKLKVNGRIISEYNSSFQCNFTLRQVSHHDEIENMKEETFYIDLYFSLDKLAIREIEKDRVKTNDNASFQVHLDIDYLSAYKNIVVQTCKDDKSISIEQSKWVKEFAPKLGIGDFILLELNNPSKEKFTKAISDMPSDSELKVFLENGLDGAYKQMKKAKDFIQEGKWSDSILALRPVIETFKTGSNRNNVTVELKEYYERSVETDNGWEQFRSLIQNSFDYASKYIHLLGQGANRNNQQLIPVAHEEDAYFVYNLCLSTLYWIKRKIER